MIPPARHFRFLLGSVGLTLLTSALLFTAMAYFLNRGSAQVLAGFLVMLLGLGALLTLPIALFSYLPALAGWRLGEVISASRGATRITGLRISAATAALLSGGLLCLLAALVAPPESRRDIMDALLFFPLVPTLLSLLIAPWYAGMLYADT